MDDATEHRIEAGGVTLSAEEAGDGHVVVLLHGLTATRRYVLMGSRALQRSGHRVIAYDARGHGRSSPAPEPRAYGYEHLASDLESVLDDLGADRALLVGASMGAHTAVRLALEEPERVAGLVLITPAYDPDTFDDPRALARWDSLSEGLREGGVEGFVAAYGTRELPEAWRDTLLQVIRQRLSAHEHPDAVADALSFVPRSRPFEQLHELAGIDVPSLVVGSRDEPDPGHPLAVAEAYARALPAAALAVEEPGASPLAWQGGRLSRLVEDLAAKAYART
jgi:pimeloyl-ACP methyl ester carboxylesterase